MFTPYKLGKIIPKFDLCIFFQFGVGWFNHQAEMSRVEPWWPTKQQGSIPVMIGANVIQMLVLLGASKTDNEHPGPVINRLLPTLPETNSKFAPENGRLEYYILYTMGFPRFPFFKGLCHPKRKRPRIPTTSIFRCFYS